MRAVISRVGVGLGALVCGLANPGGAQAAPPEKVSLEEVVVTATRREDNLLNVPVSVTAVTAASLEMSGAKNLEDVARSVPGLAIQPSDEQSDKIFVIRGIGGGSTAGGGVQSSTVAVYLDDTPITFGSSSPDLQLFDVSQVEVLRGPQGTLFGASSMGGAIRYTSTRPGANQLSGMVRSEVSFLDDGAPAYEEQAAVGGPLPGDMLSFRASGFYRHEGGYVDLRDETSGDLVDSNYNTQKSYGGRFALTAQISSMIDATASVIYQKLNEDGVSTFFSGRGITNTVDLPPLSRVDRAPAFRNDRVFLPNLTVNVDLGRAKLTSSSSYFERDLNINADFSYYGQKALGIPAALRFVGEDIEPRRFYAFVQELRLASNNDGPFSWIVGGYFRDTSESSPQSIQSNLGTLIPPYAPLLLANGSIYERQIGIDRTQYAAFGEASYKLFDRLTLTAGLRWSELEQRVARTADGLANGGHTEANLNSKEDPLTPKFAAQYQLAPHAMVYTTVAKGFREGGPNSPVPTGLAPCSAALANLGLTDAPSTFKTDSVWSYELGTKFQTADGRMRVTTAAYDIEWSKIQEVVNLTGGCGFTYIANIGKARSRGFELETAIRPSAHFTLELSAGYTDAVLTEDLISGANAAGPVIAAAKGTRLPDSPEWTFRLAPQFDFGLSRNWSAFARAELQSIGRSTRDLNTPSDDPRELNRDAYSLVNLRFGVLDGDNAIDLFVNNLLNDDTLLYQSYQNFAPGTAYEATRVRPRAIGVSYKRTF